MSRRTRTGLVYFIKPARMDGPIKIGHSQCPENRLIDLSAWSPWPLELIGSVSAPSKDERFLHHCFADCHSHREWFHSTSRLRDTIANILQAGTIEAIRSDLKPIGSIRLPRKNSPETTQRMSYCMRIYWALRKLESANGPSCYYRMSDDISQIMDRWQRSRLRTDPRPPTAEEILMLEAFLANPAAAAIRIERKLKVVA